MRSYRKISSCRSSNFYGLDILKNDNMKTFCLVNVIYAHLELFFLMVTNSTLTRQRMFNNSSLQHNSIHVVIENMKIVTLFIDSYKKN